MTRDGFERDLTDFRLTWCGLAILSTTKLGPMHAASMKTAGDVRRENAFNCLLMKKANLEKLTRFFFFLEDGYGRPVE